LEGFAPSKPLFKNGATPTDVGPAVTLQEDVLEGCGPSQPLLKSLKNRQLPRTWDPP
jgi:hypothetical protein